MDFYFIFLNLYSGGGVQLGPFGTAATNRPIVPAPGDYDGQIGGMMIVRGNRSTRRRPAPVPLCSPQTPHAARTRTRAAAVGSQRLTAWATARPNGLVTVHFWAILVNVPSYLISYFTALRIKNLALQLSRSNFHCCMQTIETNLRKSIYYSQNMIC
jgi:hypothetical protein